MTRSDLPLDKPCRNAIVSVSLWDMVLLPFLGTQLLIPLPVQPQNTLA